MIQIIPFGRTLPTEFTRYVNEATAERPRDANLGDIVVGKYGAWRLIRAGATAIGVSHAMDATIDVRTDTNLPVAVAQGQTKFSMAPGGGVIAANEFQGGLVHIVGGHHAGAQYPIAANTAKAASITDTIVLTLAQKLKVSLSTSTDVRLIADISRKAISGTADGRVYLGQAMIAIPATYYAWAQFAGIAQADAAGVATADNDGRPFIKTAGGKVDSYDGGVDPRKVIGYCMLSGVITNNDIIPLMLSPYGTF